MLDRMVVDKRKRRRLECRSLLKRRRCRRCRSVLPVDATSWNSAELAILTWQQRNTKSFPQVEVPIFREISTQRVFPINYVETYIRPPPVEHFRKEFIWRSSPDSKSALNHITIGNWRLADVCIQNSGISYFTKSFKRATSLLIKCSSINGNNNYDKRVGHMPKVLLPHSFFSHRGGKGDKATRRAVV